MVIFFKVSVHTITEAEQYVGLGRTELGLSQGGGSSSQVIKGASPGVAPPL